jgi:hypothetical protein
MTEELDVIEKQVKTLPKSVKKLLMLMSEGYSVSHGTWSGFEVPHAEKEECWVDLHLREIYAARTRGLINIRPSRTGDAPLERYYVLSDLGKEVSKRI